MHRSGEQFDGVQYALSEPFVVSIGCCLVCAGLVLCFAACRPYLLFTGLCKWQVLTGSGSWHLKREFRNDAGVLPIFELLCLLRASIHQLSGASETTFY